MVSLDGMGMGQRGMYPGPLRIQNVLHVLLKEVSQRNITIMVKTAWHHRAVAQYTYLVSEPIAGHLFPCIRGGKIRG